jgi:hypothetical protein
MGMGQATRVPTGVRLRCNDTTRAAAQCHAGRTGRRQPQAYVPFAFSFADAKLAEHRVQDLFHVHDANHFADGV